MMPLWQSRVTIPVILSIIVTFGAGITIEMLTPDALDFAGGQPVLLTKYKGPTPVGIPPEMSSTDIVRRGEYLTKAADCEICHTQTGGQLYAGGRAFKTQFGTLYSPNITADKETGIGGWSDADFIRAAHMGIAKDGSHLYPAFPYESYTLLADDDLRAIKAYLFTLPVAHASAPANALAFPFNQRWLMAFWSIFYDPNHRFRPHADRSPEWNRGAYLAEGLAHCGDCHTPRNLAQAPDNRDKFAGAVTDGWRAYNITSDRVSGIGAWTDDELAAYLSIGYAAGRGTAGGPMAEVIDASLSALSPADIHAIVAYLRSIPAISTPDLPAPRVTPASDLPKEMAATFDPRGKQVFEGACTSCHSWSGVSLITNEATLIGNRSVNDRSATNVAQMIISGERRQTRHGTIFMPAFGDAYSDIEIAAVANYVTARFGAKNSFLTAQDVARLR
jgi:mono/diheme cytochrome c family protein